MKKLLLTCLSAIGFFSMAIAAQTTTPIAEDYTFIAQPAMQSVAVNSNTNFDDYIKCYSTNNYSYATNKGMSTIDGQDYYNCMQIKGGRGLKFSVSEVCTITIYGQVNSDRYFKLGTADTLDDIFACGTTGGVYSYTFTESNLNKDIFLSASSDLYLAGLKFTFNTTDPKITANSEASIAATESGVEVTKEIAVTGANLTGSTLTATLSPAVEGLSVTLDQNTIADGAISATATLHYTATANTSGTTTLTLSDGTTSKEVTVNYSANVVAHELQSISTTTTWDWSKITVNTGSSLYANNGIQLNAESTPSNGEYVVYADYEGTHMTIASGFNTEAIAFMGEYPARNGTMCQNGTIKFNTTVPGTISVKFSDTGSSVSATATPRYLYVNGVNTGYSVCRPTSGSTKSNDEKTVSYEVGAGDVEITGKNQEGTAAAAICVYTVTFTPAVSATIAASGYTTVTAPFNFTVAGGTPYYAASTGAESVTLTSVEAATVFEAGTGLMIKGEAGATVTLTATSAAVTFNETNLLVGVTAADQVMASGTNYVLATKNTGETAFYLYKGEATPLVGKAYLNVAGGSASALRIDIEGMEDGMETAISLTPSLSEGEGACYDLYGRKSNGKGLMIQNGKVVLVK